MYSLYLIRNTNTMLYSLFFSFKCGLLSSLFAAQFAIFLEVYLFEILFVLMSISIKIAVHFVIVKRNVRMNHEIYNKLLRICWMVWYKFNYLGGLCNQQSWSFYFQTQLNFNFNPLCDERVENRTVSLSFERKADQPRKMERNQALNCLNHQAHWYSTCAWWNSWFSFGNGFWL